eukprot:scaffold15718_cov107-Isochrysis_galbana.AAC.7
MGAGGRPGMGAGGRPKVDAGRRPEIGAGRAASARRRGQGTAPKTPSADGACESGTARGGLGCFTPLHGPAGGVKSGVNGRQRLSRSGAPACVTRRRGEGCNLRSIPDPPSPDPQR